MTMDPITDLRPGLSVHTLDGDQIGKVKAVEQALFKVNAPLQPDYWLPRDQVLSFTNERVTMNFNADRLGDFKHDG